MVNGSRYYRALESVSIASALSSALTIYPCQIRVHQRRQSKLQLLTARKKEWWPATADSLPQAATCQRCDAHHVSRHRTHNLPIVSPTRYHAVGLPIHVVLFEFNADITHKCLRICHRPNVWLKTCFVFILCLSVCLSVRLSPTLSLSLSLSNSFGLLWETIGM